MKLQNRQRNLEAANIPNVLIDFGAPEDAIESIADELRMLESYVEREPGSLSSRVLRRLIERCDVVAELLWRAHTARPEPDPADSGTRQGGAE